MSREHSVYTRSECDIDLLSLIKSRREREALVDLIVFAEVRAKGAGSRPHWYQPMVNPNWAAALYSKTHNLCISQRFVYKGSD